MDPDLAKSSLDLGDTKSASPLRRITEKKGIGRLLSRAKHGMKQSIDESFDMGMPDKRDRKRIRERPSFPYPSPEKRQHRSTSPSRMTASGSPAPPVAYRSPRPKFSPPTRLDSRPVPPTPPKEPLPASIPLPASPHKSASSWRAQNSDIEQPGSGTDSPANRLETPSAVRLSPAQTSPRRSGANARSPTPHPPVSPDIFTEFDRLFADFPHPPAGSPLPHAVDGLPTPALTAGTSSSYSSSSGSSRSPAALSPYPPPDPGRLESAINTLSQVILCLQGTQADHTTYALRQEDMLHKLQSMEREMAGVRAENLRLEVNIRRERDERVRAEKEREDLRASMLRKAERDEEEMVISTPDLPPSLYIAESQTKATSTLTYLQNQTIVSAKNIHNLQAQLSASQTKVTFLESRNKMLEGEISRLTGAFDLFREDYRVKEEEMRRRMEEAEFMHQALKESGARLGRELDGARKKYSDLEKKARGGYI